MNQRGMIRLRDLMLCIIAVGILWWLLRVLKMIAGV